MPPQVAAALLPLVRAPVPVVELHKRTYVPGGAANTAANLAGLQAEVYLVGIRGGDETGQHHESWP